MSTNIKSEERVFQFFKLPAEVRNIIYRFCLPSAPIRLQRHNYDEEWYLNNLCYTNHEMYTEASRILYSKGRFLPGVNRATLPNLANPAFERHFKQIRHPVNEISWHRDEVWIDVSTIELDPRLMSCRDSVLRCQSLPSIVIMWCTLEYHLDRTTDVIFIIFLKNDICCVLF